MSARRIVGIGLLSFLAITCAWVPWQAPGFHSTADNEFDLRPDSGGAIVQLGYGWIWIGPTNLQGEVPQSSAMLATMDNIGRSQAERNALVNGLPPPSEDYLKTVGQIEHQKWAARIEFPRTYYRNHATPDYGRILLTMGMGVAIVGAFYLLPRRKNHG
jgi:hypothetical protein